MTVSNPNPGDRDGPDRLTRALARVRLAAFDFDGVFTDNTVWVDDSGIEAVRCWRGDGLGLSALRSSGVETVVISTEANPVVDVRCKKLGVPCRHGIDNKLDTLRDIARDLGCALEETVFVGNDINDLECLREVGVPIVVSDAHPDVRQVAMYTTLARGGRGAVREVCDLVRRARESVDDAG